MCAELLLVWGQVDLKDSFPMSMLVFFICCLTASISMAADRQGFGDLIDDDDSDCAAEHSVVVPFPEPRSGSKRPAVKALAAEVRSVYCWLCTEPGATSTWKQFQCHDKCVNALRCHTRMVDPKDRELDEGWLQ